MPAHFDKLGIAFQYPDNWSLDEQDALAGKSSVTVCSPGGAFWSVSRHPRNADPLQLAKAAVEAVEDDYHEVEVDEARETMAEHVMVGFDMQFFYLDLLNTAQVRCIQTDSATYSVFCQAEDREFDRIEAVFRAMTISFLHGLGPASGP